MFEIFDRVYCIHLPDAKRRTHMEQQLGRVGIRNVRYVHASQPPAGFKLPNMRRNPRAEFGANLSHLAAIATAMADRADRPLFLEDDICFVGPEAVSAPAEWDVLYLGGHPREPVMRAGPGLVRVRKFSFAEAYAVRGELLGELHAYWCNRISQPHAMFDFILGEFAAARRSYCFYPVLTEQAFMPSHISGEIDDKRGLIARGWAANLVA